MNEAPPNPDSRHPACMSDEALLDQCDVIRTRGRGPGGQHRNKVETMIVITHRETGVVGQAGETRSQHRNQQQALHRLRINLALAVRARPTGPSERWQQRVRGKKISVSTDHPDLGPLLAEALDHLNDAEFEIAATAEKLGISSSQLIKFLKQTPEAWEQVNRQRTNRGLHRLK